MKFNIFDSAKSAFWDMGRKLILYNIGTYCYTYTLRQYMKVIGNIRTVNVFGIIYIIPSIRSLAIPIRTSICTLVSVRVS